MSNRTKSIYLAGINAYKQKNFEVAASIFVTLAKKEKNSSVIHFFAGVSLFMIKKYSMAVTYFEKVIEWNKSYQQKMKSCIFLGYVYIKQDKYQEALDVLRVPVGENYSNPYAFSMMGYLSHLNKEYEEADSYYKKCLESDPDNPSFNNNYGYNLLVWKKDLEESVSYLEKAVKKDQKNSAYLHSLGWVMYLKKRYEEAYKILDMAFKQKKDPLIKKHLEMAKGKLPKKPEKPKKPKKK